MFNHLKTHFKNYIQFLKEPNPKPNHQKITKKKKWQTLFIFLLIDFLLVIPAVFIVFLIQEISELDFDNHAISDLTNNYGLLALILLGGILMPFIEEIIFRLPLNYKRNYLFKLVGRIVGRQKVKNFWFKYYKVFFYLFIFAFGLVHITNYMEESTNILLLSPFLVLPQIVGGSIMAYLRMNLGFLWGFLQHSIFNTALMLITFYTNLEEKVIIDNNDFKLRIEVAENRFGKEKIININRDFDFITEIDIKYARFNQIAKQLNWDTIHTKRNYKHYNIDFTIKNLEIRSDSVLHEHLMEIIEDQ